VAAQVSDLQRDAEFKSPFLDQGIHVSRITESAATVSNQDNAFVSDRKLFEFFRPAGESFNRQIGDLRLKPAYNCAFDGINHCNPSVCRC
jgi:hypothetical protein